jgi:hypothetical protein
MKEGEMFYPYTVVYRLQELKKVVVLDAFRCNLITDILRGFF